jgi:hypothetical protein
VGAAERTKKSPSRYAGASREKLRLSRWRGSLVGRLIARAIISPMRNRTRGSSISWLYPVTRNANKFSPISSLISSPHSPAEKSRSGLSGKRATGHRLAPHQQDNILTLVLFPRPGARERTWPANGGECGILETRRNNFRRAVIDLLPGFLDEPRATTVALKLQSMKLPLMMHCPSG